MLSVIGVANTTGVFWYSFSKAIVSQFIQVIVICHGTTNSVLKSARVFMLWFIPKEVNKRAKAFIHNKCIQSPLINKKWTMLVNPANHIIFLWCFFVWWKSFFIVFLNEKNLAIELFFVLLPAFVVLFCNNFLFIAYIVLNFLLC